MRASKEPNPCAQGAKRKGRWGPRAERGDWGTRSGFAGRGKGAIAPFRKNGNPEGFPVRGCISRVLLLGQIASTQPVFILLRFRSPRIFSDIPESLEPLPSRTIARTHTFLFCLAPDGVCQATLVAKSPVSSYLAVSPLPHRCQCGGLFSVALSSGSPPPVVNWHPARWSSDFPPGCNLHCSPANT